MKRINTIFAFLAIIIASVILLSCSKEEDPIDNKDPRLSSEVLEQLSLIGLDGSDLAVMNKQDLLPGDNANNNFLVEGCLVMSPQQIKSLAERNRKDGPRTEQYSTDNLVSQNRTINVMGYIGNNANGLTADMQSALQRAIDNYNALNISLDFTLTYGVNYYSSDIVVYKINGSAGGIAGFPTEEGNPFPFVRILAGTGSYGPGVLEHVITHELGHCVGLRHTDYFNRAISCGGGGNEGPADVGANHVPGTPTGADLNSVMLACFDTNETGEFGNYDVVALEHLY